MKARITRGAGFRGALDYVLDEGKKATGKKKTEIISTNLPGRDAVSFAAAFGAFRRLRPDVKKPVWHSSLRLPAGDRLDAEVWERITLRYLQIMGFDEATPYLAGRHNDLPDGDHIHILASRINSQAVLWLGQNEVYRAIAATQQIEREFGLTLTHGLGEADAESKATRKPRVADSQSVINANRARGQPRIDTAETARVLLDCAARSHDLPTFTAAAAVAGIKVLPNKAATTGYLSGLSVVPVGRKKALSMSEATKNRLSWPKLLKTWERNAELAEAARSSARDAVADADSSAATRVTTRLEKQPQSESPISQPDRVLTPSAIHDAKELAMTDDKLDFLNFPPPPRPDSVLLDDAGLSMSPAALEDGEASFKKKTKKEQEERDRDRAQLDMQTEIRKLSVRELLDLRSKVPPFVMTAAAIEALINLMIRLLSLGLVKRVDNLSSALAARQELQQYAEAELDRRRRTPAGLAERKAALEEYAEAMQERSIALDKRHSDRTMAAAYRDPAREAAESAALRKQQEAGLDRRQVARGHDTIKKRRADHQAAVLAHRAVRDEKLVPAGFGGLLITKAQRDAAAAAQAEAALKLKQAAERRAEAKEQLQVLLDEVEEAAVKNEQEAAESQAAVKKAEAIERDALAHELRSIPDQIIVVSAQAQQVHHAERAAVMLADAARPLTEAELAAEAAEAERLRLLALIHRG